jgi:leucyl aminopeptidase
MNILASKKIEMGAVPVMVLNSEKKVTSHPFYIGLPEEDKILLGQFLAKTNFQKVTVHTVFLPSGNRVVVLGIGDRKQFTFRKSVLAMRKVIATAKEEGLKAIGVNTTDFFVKGVTDPAYIAETMATQFSLANFQYIHFKTPPKEGWNFVQTIHVLGKENLSKAVERGRIIGEEINATRELANTPGSSMTPRALGEAAQSAGKSRGITVRVLDEKKIAELGMGGLLAVGQGSDNPPRFIIMEYLAGPKKEPPVVLVGKGITFDSGGLNLKSSDHIYEMHMDMSGGAAVIHTVAALARLKTKRNVIGLISAAENMPSGNSYRPGDVVRTMNGKTIEIMNTDAEGRVVLADALEYAKKYNPRLVVDIATLTGAAMTALGMHTSALFTTNQKLENIFRETGERTADLVWPLPLWEEYENDIKSVFGDWANVSKTRYGGAITAAVFLWQFIKPFAWVHLDIAPRMTSTDGDHLAKGAAGAPVNLLVHLLEKY